MPHWGIHSRISTSCSPATPSWNPRTMPREATNVASDASSPTPLMAPAAFFGKNTSSTAAAMGSQRTMERMLMTVLSWPLAVGSELSANGQLPTANSSKYPYENDHPHE